MVFLANPPNKTIESKKEIGKNDMQKEMWNSKEETNIYLKLTCFSAQLAFIMLFQMLILTMGSLGHVLQI